MRLFRWFSAEPIPAAYDLRRAGWQLLTNSRSSGPFEAHVTLGLPHRLPLAQWLSLAGANPAQRKWMMMLEVDELSERTRMLRLGFGDALGRGPTLEEIEARVLRLEQLAQSLPRYRIHAAIKLDLLAREAYVAGRAVGLHPREFALLWRLAETPGEAVSAAELLYDVWRLSFRPETNSLAVHVSRLRAKLRTSGVDGLVETHADGSYQLAAAGAGAKVHNDLALDGFLRIGEEHLIF